MQKLQRLITAIISVLFFLQASLPAAFAVEPAAFNSATAGQAAHTAFVNPAHSLAAHATLFNPAHSLAAHTSFNPAHSLAGHATIGSPAHSLIDLNLGSTTASIAASSILHGHNSVDITTGLTTQVVTPASHLTAAEALAVFQVVSTGHQSLLLNGSGAADGGSFVIGNHLSHMLTGLDIPNGVTAIDRAGTLNISGSLINSGSIYAVSFNPHITTATINASNIVNNTGALITSVYPPHFASTLPSWGAGILPAHSLNLNLNALNNIVNAGAIASSGNLSLTAGGSISNLHNLSIAPAAISAVNNLNLQAPQIVNFGAITSQTGNISITSPGNTLAINNTGGTITAGNQLSFQTLASTITTSLDFHVTE